MPGMPSVLQPLATTKPSVVSEIMFSLLCDHRHRSWAWKDKTVRRRGRGRAHRVGAASRLTGRATAAVVPSLLLRSTASSSNSSGGSTTHPAPTRQLSDEAMGQFVLVGSCPHVTQLAAQLSGTSSTSSSSPRPGAASGFAAAIWSLLFKAWGGVTQVRRWSGLVRRVNHCCRARKSTRPRDQSQRSRIQ